MKFHIVTDTDGRVAAGLRVTGHGHEVIPGAKAAVIAAGPQQALHDLDMPDGDYARLRSQDFPRGPVYLDVSRAAETLKHRS